jgi:CheY-like chemotaxis protein
LIPVDTYQRPSLPHAPEDGRGRRSLRFLVVDDTEELRELMARMIVREGHVVEEAADGIEATAALADHRYDVMLLDLSMPRMSGEDVVRWLHANPDRADGMRTVVVTAWGGERRGTLQELGITTVLSKPFRLQQLLDLVSDIATEAADSAAERAPQTDG